jgi:uncharacterized membrane protein (DUF106 family)
VSDEALPSAESEAAPDEPATDSSDSTTEAPKPAAPVFKFSTFLLTFLFVMGIYMLFDQQARNAVAEGLNGALYPAIGFGYTYPLLTMFLAAVLEMLITAIAYNYTTDWIKQAKVAKWNAAFRKVQLEAMRSGKKDRIEALKPFQQRLTMLSSEVSIAQLKGMAVTWFLVIAIYTWVGIFIHAAYNQGSDLLTLGGASAHLYLGLDHIAFLPLWFLIFSLYTIPSSIAFRRVLKHYWLVLHARTLPNPPGSGGVSA